VDVTNKKTAKSCLFLKIWYIYTMSNEKIADEIIHALRQAHRELLYDFSDDMLRKVILPTLNICNPKTED